MKLSKENMYWTHFICMYVCMCQRGMCTIVSMENMYWTYLASMYEAVKINMYWTYLVCMYEAIKESYKNLDIFYIAQLRKNTQCPWHKVRKKWAIIHVTVLVSKGEGTAWNTMVNQDLHVDRMNWIPGQENNQDWRWTVQRLTWSLTCRHSSIKQGLVHSRTTGAEPSHWKRNTCT